MDNGAGNNIPFVFFAHRTMLLDAEIASQTVSRFVAPMRIIPMQPGGLVDLTFSFGIIPNIKIWTVQIRQGLDLTILTKEDRQIIYFPGTGELTVETTHGTFVNDDTRGVNVEADGLRRVRYFPGRSGAGMGVDRPALLQRLATLLDAPIRRRLEFKPQFDSAVAHRTAVGEMIGAITSRAVGAALTASPATAAKMSATLLDLILQSLPHNFSEDLLQPPKRIAPRHVKRAMDYIESHAHLAITISDLAETCDVSIRSLQYGFRQFLDVSPADHIRTVRLERARRAIIDDAHTPLATIAQHWGFTNLTRFSARFKAAYGETPTEFRRRRPSAPAAMR